MLSCLEALFRDLQEGREILTHQVQALPLEARRKPVRGGAWTPLQILEHVVLVEGAAIRWIRSGREPGPITLKGKIVKTLMRGFFALRLRAKAPVPQVLPAESPVIGEIHSRWDEIRQDLQAYLEAVQPQTLLQPVFRHPLAGAMHIQEALRFLTLHLRHHRHQVTQALK